MLPWLQGGKNEPSHVEKSDISYDLIYWGIRRENKVSWPLTLKKWPLISNSKNIKMKKWSTDVKTQQKSKSSHVLIGYSVWLVDLLERKNK